MLMHVTRVSNYIYFFLLVLGCFVWCFGMSQGFHLRFLFFHGDGAWQRLPGPKNFASLNGQSDPSASISVGQFVVRLLFFGGGRGGRVGADGPPWCH